jgi:hypothetical protein
VNAGSVGSALLVCLLVYPPVGPAGAPSDAELLRRAEDAFLEGAAERADAERSQAAFVEAAAGYEALCRRGRASADLFRNLGNACLLAGDLPRAIRAYRSGLSLCPHDTRLWANLTYARRQVVPPPPPETDWLAWMPRPITLLVVSAVAYAVAWALGGWWWVARRPWLPRAAGAGLFLALTAGTVLVLERGRWEEEAAHPPVVIARDGVALRTGDGPHYPLSREAPLNRGVEARLLFRRGPWLQVELCGGRVGWIPQDDALVDAGGT